MSPTADRVLFDSAFLAKLEQLHLLAKRIFRGDHRADRRSRQLGSSLEFADYREYSAGDELRRIDWPAYARLGRLFVKLYEQEQDLPAYFLVDASASMQWTAREETAHRKFDAARRITAALSYIALANLDAVNIHLFADGLGAELGFARGKSDFHRVLTYLNDAKTTSTRTDLAAAVHSFTQRVKRRGLVYVISDFFDPAYEESLAKLRHAQFEVHVLQLLDPAELDPKETGDLRVIEVEGGSSMDVTANETLLRRYREEVAAYNNALERHCLQKAMAHARTTCDVPFEDVVLRILRDGVMLK